MKNVITDIQDLNARGWVLYDGRCGACSAAARRLRRRVGGMGYQVVPRETAWITEKFGADILQYPRDMLLIMPSGKIFAGVDAYLEIAAEKRWSRPLVWIARQRLVMGVLRWIYKGFAGRRQRISAICRLKPDISDR